VSEGGYRFYETVISPCSRLAFIEGTPVGADLKVTLFTVIVFGGTSL
jgi:hypothetical protein